MAQWSLVRHWRNRLSLMALVLLAQAPWAAPLPDGRVEISPFFKLRPGVSSRVELESVLGAPSRQISALVFEYRAPAGANDIDRETAEFFPETPHLARIDAYVRTPLPAAALRAQFGAPVVQRQRSDGQREELFYPRLNGLIFAPDKPDEVIAISYLSPRALADRFADESNREIGAKRYAQALEAADKAVAADPDYARGYLVQGFCYYFQENYKEAMVRFVAATHAKYSAHKQAHAHSWIGAIYWKVDKQIDKAGEAYRTALRVGPDYDVVHLEYGKFLRAQNQRDQALAEFDKAVQLNPAGADARNAMAMIYYDRKDWSRALAHLKVLIAWADSPAAATFDAVFKAGIYARYAYSLAASLPNRSPLSPEPHASAAIVANYEKALALLPGDTFSSIRLGLEYMEQEQATKAVEVYRKGLAANARDLALNQQLADALLAARRFDEARRQAELALSINPGNYAQMMNVARAYGAMRNRAQAVSWIRKAVAAGYQPDLSAFNLEDGYFDDVIKEDELRGLLGAIF